MSKYFTLQEMLRSETALRKKIDNSPSYEIVRNLERLAEFLDQLREAWGSGIRVSSGFRCVQLNNAVGGVQNSQHIYGCAADIQPSNGKFNEFVAFLKKWLAGRAFDKCIIETSKSSGARWIHIVWKSSQGYQRRKLFDMEAK